MATYYITDIADVVSGELIKGSGGKFSYLLIDSRKVLFPRESLFFALRGKRNDGHLFIDELYKIGVRNFVVEEFPSGIDENYPRASFLKVKSSFAALQQIVAWHRKHFNMPVIGITGSNGKTIVKEWIYQCLSDSVRVVRNPKSFNSQVGVPLSVWLLNETSQLGVFEAGISKPHEMERLQQIMEPNVGVFTNIGDAHQENFESIQQKIEEKVQLFKSCKTIVYCVDNLPVHKAIVALNDNRKLFTWSTKSEADVVLKSVKQSKKHTKLEVNYNDSAFKIKVPFSDRASVENAISTLCLLLVLNVPLELIQTKIAALEAVGMRLELKEGVNNCTVINDSYNSDLESLHIALDFLCYQSQHNQRLLVLSDIAQSGYTDSELYRKVAIMIKQKNIDRLIGIGTHISQFAEYFDLRKDFFETTREFLEEYPFPKLHNITILLKGARSFEFEHISKRLQKQSHRTVFEIDLNAIEQNLNYFKNYLKPSTGIIAMLKASSYGSGTHEIASLCQFQRVAAIAVAFPDEGIELRESGIQLPIMVMNPEEDNFQSLMEYQLEPQIYNFQTLHEVNRLAEANDNFPYPVHIKLDTGMHRSGFLQSDLEQLVAFLKLSKHIRVKTVFSHLAVADEADQDEYTLKQVELFEEMSQALMQELGYSIKRHILNSAGVERFGQYQFDMVRLGIGLYGISSINRKLTQVGTLKSSIAQIKTITAGNTIGYGRKGIAKTDTLIATVPIGYADGLRRSLSNGVGKFYINGKLAPIIGNVCMDMCMIDITGIKASEGDEVEVFGKHLPLQQVADWMGTIPYEVLTSISKRVKRTYLAE